MIEIRSGRDLGEAYRRRITEVYTAAFAEDFSELTTDLTTLTDAFEHMLIIEAFQVAMVDGQPAALTSFTFGTQQAARPRLRPLCKHLGPVKGTIGRVVFGREFTAVPTGAPPDAACFGFVGTAPQYRGMGVARTLLQHLVDLPEHHLYYVEDVADTNTPALNLYRGLGFTEYKRRPVKHTKRTGINAYISLQLDQR